MASSTTTTTAPQVLIVYGGLPPCNRYNPSPFVTKLEARLRFSHRAYQLKAGSLSKAPKRKIPYIQLPPTESRDQSAPVFMGDSDLIARKLIDLGEVDDFNAELSAAQKAQDYMLRILVEEKIYYFGVYERWIVPENFYKIRDELILYTIPYPIRLVVGQLVYRSVMAALHGQGTGRHTVEELDAMREESVRVLNDFVVDLSNDTTGGNGKRKTGWIFNGENPTEADAALYGFLAAILTTPANPKMIQTIKEYPALVSYADRIHNEYFPDYEKWPV